MRGGRESGRGRGRGGERAGEPPISLAMSQLSSHP